ncbi:MAG: DUF58 domain-containing protein [Muribaculaceae bacterium]|nr:DUF58 domain-containing protein [Muribaculaceae bacterium]
MFLTRRFYILAVLAALVMAAGHFWPVAFTIGVALLCLVVLVLLVDLVLLYRGRVEGRRKVGRLMSNGDDNKVKITLNSTYSLPINVEVIDEAPVVFERRDISFKTSIERHGDAVVRYTLHPTRRGVYGFGLVRAFVSTPLGMARRRFNCGEAQDVKVYPSYLKLRQYELMAIHNNLTLTGIKRIRRAGNQTEFEQIKDYVTGDDYRTINWKATARRNQFMVNVYQDERSQQVISVIDKGRVMQQAFEGMTLLDYAINASLVISHIATTKADNAGLVTIEKQLDTYVKPGRGPKQMRLILDALYSQETTFGETDLSELCVNTMRMLNKRSLFILYTNFLSFNAMMRQLPFLRQLNHRHRLLVVFFEDGELDALVKEKPSSMQDYYCQVIGEKLASEKQLIVSTLRQHGIYSLLTRPQDLSVDLINKYLEMKSRHLF